jgi:acetyl-CoA carboxylase biotin carboxyl carrier protein
VEKDDMAQGDAKDGGEVFDIVRVRALVELMNEHDLSEIDLRQGPQRVRLRRGAEAPVMMTAPLAAAPAAQPAAVAPAAPVVGTAPTTPAAAMGPVIKSPMVGTFYSSASPDTAPFVKVGDQVGPDTTICIIEAMKVFNEIPAECSGKIAAILVTSGAAVEYGQPLFRLE